MDEIAALIGAASPTVILALLLYDGLKRYDTLAQRLASIAERFADADRQEATRQGHERSGASQSALTDRYK